MASFRIRCYENGDARWIELLGAAAATQPARLRAEIAAAFAHREHGEDENEPRRFILDLSQVIAVGAPTLEAILDAVPRGPEIGLIPPPEPGWFAEISKRIDLSVAVYANERHALLALGLVTRGRLLDRPEEHRRHVRVETSIKARMWFRAPRGERGGRVIIANMSKSGALLTRLECDLGPEDFIHFAQETGSLHLSLPLEMEMHKLRSRVVRIDTTRGAPHLGVRFEELDPLFERALSRYIAERCPEEKPAPQSARLVKVRRAGFWE
jgi:hypothetical protein